MTDEQIEKLKSLASQLLANPANAVKTLGQILKPQQIRATQANQAASRRGCRVEHSRSRQGPGPDRRATRETQDACRRSSATRRMRRSKARKISNKCARPGRHAREAPCLRRASPDPATAGEVRKDERPQNQPGPFENLSEAAPLPGSAAIAPNAGHSCFHGRSRKHAAGGRKIPCHPAVGLHFVAQGLHWV